MRNRAAYDNMRAHWEHLESKCGDGVLNKPWDEVIRIAKENGCKDDLKVIHECVETCPYGYYGANRVCYPCSNNCGGCQSKEQCDVCRPGSFLEEGYCVGSNRLLC